MTTSPSSPRVIGWRPSLNVMAASLLMAIGLALMADAAWIHVKARVAQVLLERAFAESIATKTPVKPWSWADTWPVARITVPRLRASAIALAGSSGQALAFGPGHIEGTPAAGDPGTAVYAAHRDTHFAFLGDLQPGDEIEVTTAANTHQSFRVTHTTIARWDAASIDPDRTKPRLILTTCWPLDARTAGPLRYLVHAEAIRGASAAGLTSRHGAPPPLHTAAKTNLLSP